MDLDALAVAIDTARLTGDHGVLYDDLAVQGWRRPSRKQPSTEEIAANVTVDPVTGCWLWRGRIDRPRLRPLARPGRPPSLLPGLRRADPLRHHIDYLCLPSAATSRGHG